MSIGKVKPHGKKTDLEDAVGEEAPGFLYRIDSFPGLTTEDVKQLFAQNDIPDGKGNHRPHYVLSNEERGKYYV